MRLRKKDQKKKSPRKQVEKKDAETQKEEDKPRKDLDKKKGEKGAGPKKEKCCQSRLWVWSLIWRRKEKSREVIRKKRDIFEELIEEMCLKSQQGSLGRYIFY